MLEVLREATKVTEISLNNITAKRVASHIIVAEPVIRLGNLEILFRSHKNTYLWSSFYTKQAKNKIPPQIHPNYKSAIETKLLYNRVYLLSNKKELIYFINRGL